MTTSLLNRTGAQKYVERGSIQRIQGLSTDFLMISGIGSLNLSIVLDYAFPLIAVCFLGLFITWFWLIYIRRKVL